MPLFASAVVNEPEHLRKGALTPLLACSPWSPPLAYLVLWVWFQEFWRPLSIIGVVPHAYLQNESRQRARVRLPKIRDNPAIGGNVCNNCIDPSPGVPTLVTCPQKTHCPMERVHSPRFFSILTAAPTLRYTLVRRAGFLLPTTAAFLATPSSPARIATR